MNKYFIFLFGLIFSFQCSCSSKNSVADYPGLELCVGFDHSKRFPNRRNRPFGVNYDRNKKMLTGQDGVWYFSSNGRDKKWRQYYQEDLEISAKERNYIKCYEAKEKLFDEEFGGEIKSKLLAVSGTSVLGNGNQVVLYPVYLEGKALPKGLVTPCSYFSSSFISAYVEAVGHQGDLEEYVLSTELIQDAEMRDLAGMVREDVAGQIFSRYKSVFGEYVMSYYYLKKYDDPLERTRVFNELANYYAELALRSAGEALYRYKNSLSDNQRRKISEYVAIRVYEFISRCSNKHFIKELKIEYQDTILDNCYYNLVEGRYKKKYDYAWKNRKSKNEYLRKTNQLKELIRSGVERCVND